MDIVIRSLTKEFLGRHLNEFIEILSDIPGEYWGREHFLLDLQGKFIHSCYALDNIRLAGYIIASESGESTVHIHKFMVAAGYRGIKIGSRMLDFFEASLKVRGIREVSLKVEKSNEKGIKFYMNHGFLFIAASNTGHNESQNLSIMTKTL